MGRYVLLGSEVSKLAMFKLVLGGVVRLFYAGFR